MSLHNSRHYVPSVTNKPPKIDPYAPTKTMDQVLYDKDQQLGESIVRYVGGIDPETKKREGTGYFQYSNQYFTYEGEWSQGKKNGKGKLTMKDGSYYEGEFKDGEMYGEGKMEWANGNKYIGQFLNGEKSGFGKFFSFNGDVYEGEWKKNVRFGAGKLICSEYTAEGEFQNHKPHGKISIEYKNGDKYNGEINMGILEGKGVFESAKQKYIYEGEWHQNKKNGNGLIKYLEQPFLFDGEFEDDNPKILPNLMRGMAALAGKEQETIDSNKTSKSNVKKGETEAENIEKVVGTYEIGGNPINFDILVMYQPPAYEDPNQPTQEEIEELVKQAQKDAKKTKKNVNPEDFQKPRMIVPDPYVIRTESGRILQLKMRAENVNDIEKGTLVRLDYRQDIKDRKQEIAQKKEEAEKQALEQLETEQEEAKKSNKKAPRKTMKGKNQSSAQVVDESIKFYTPDEPEEKKPLTVVTTDGRVKIEELEFPDDQPGGLYYITVEDKTPEHIIQPLPSLLIELTIINPNETGKKKKK